MYKYLVNRCWQYKIVGQLVVAIPNSWSIGGGNYKYLVNRCWQYQIVGQLVVAIPNSCSIGGGMMYKYLVNRCWKYQIAETNIYICMYVP